MTFNVARQIRRCITPLYLMIARLFRFLTAVVLASSFVLSPLGGTQNAHAEAGNPGYIIAGGVLTLVAAGATLGAIDKASDIRELCVVRQGEDKVCDQLKRERNTLLGVALLSGAGAVFAFAAYGKSGKSLEPHGLINLGSDKRASIAFPGVSFDRFSGKSRATLLTLEF